MMNSLRDNKGSYRAEPATANLGVGRAKLKGLCEPFETICDPRQCDLADCRTFGWPMRGFVEVVGKHQRDEQHRALGAEATRRPVRGRPAFGDHRAQQADARLFAVVAALSYFMARRNDVTGTILVGTATLMLFRLGFGWA